MIKKLEELKNQFQGLNLYVKVLQGEYEEMKSVIDEIFGYYYEDFISFFKKNPIIIKAFSLDEVKEEALKIAIKKISQEETKIVDINVRILNLLSYSVEKERFCFSVAPSENLIHFGAEVSIKIERKKKNSNNYIIDLEKVYVLFPIIIGVKELQKEKEKELEFILQNIYRILPV